MLFLVASLLFATSAHAALEAKWLSVASIYLSDGKTQLIFDPAYTKPKIGNWLLNRELHSDPVKVEKFLGENGITKANAIFVSHTHFDHVVDAPDLAERFQAKLYGGASIEEIVKAYQARKPGAKIAYQLAEDFKPIQVGAFKVTPIRREHAAIFPKIGFKFLPGLIAPPFGFKFYDYREGEVWCFMVEHPEGRIFIDQGSRLFEPAFKLAEKADVLFFGIANKESVPDLVDRFIGRVSPQVAIPVHFDVFFLDRFADGKVRLPGLDAPAVEARLKEKFPQVRLEWPVLGKSIALPTRRR